MLKRICIVLAIALFIPTFAFGSGNVIEKNDISISASSAVAIDFASKKVLFDKLSNKICSMASTTKIMTCLIACESDKLYNTVTINSEMLNGAIGSLIYLSVGDKISFIDLIKGAMLSSGNDAANAIAVYVAGSLEAFVDIMNERANVIGMSNTLFVTPSGLDEGDHHSTAYDMALLTAEALKNEVFKSICSLESDQIAINGVNQTIYNHNKLLSMDDDFIGVKTGFTEKSGRCLVSAYNFKGNIIIIVTLGAPDDWNDHIKLVKYSNQKYKKHKDTLNYNISVVGGAKNTALCTARYSLYSLGKITTKAYYYPFIYSPAKSEDIIGYVEIYSDNLLVMTVDIIVKEDV